MLGIFFYWEPQAATVVKAVRLTEEERNRTRCLLLNSRHRMIAASGGSVVSFALTPGYETYESLGGTA